MNVLAIMVNPVSSHLTTRAKHLMSALHLMLMLEKPGVRLLSMIMVTWPRGKTALCPLVQVNHYRMAKLLWIVVTLLNYIQHAMPLMLHNVKLNRNQWDYDNNDRRCQLKLCSYLGHCIETVFWIVSHYARLVMDTLSYSRIGPHKNASSLSCVLFVLSSVLRLMSMPGQSHGCMANGRRWAGDPTHQARPPERQQKTEYLRGVFWILS